MQAAVETGTFLVVDSFMIHQTLVGIFAACQECEFKSLEKVKLSSPAEHFRGILTFQQKLNIPSFFVSKVYIT